jgi:hypothetical protein
VAANESIAESLIQRNDKLRGERGTWESHWQEIAERVLPRQARQFQTFKTQITPGEKRTEKMFDSTAAIALERFAAVTESMLTPRNSKWHRVKASLPELNKIHRVATWFDELTDVLFRYRYSPRANFASQNHENYIGLGAFGTAVMFTDPLDPVSGAGGLRYKSVSLDEVVFLENHQGLIDTVFRQFPLKARQAIQRWGESAGEKVVQAMEKNPEEEFEFLHVVQPNDDMDPSRADYRGMAYRSYYISVKDKMVISEGGYRSFPYAVSRYVTAPGECYGRSPAMLALPSIKTLNEQKKTILKQGHRAVDPVLLLHDDGILDTFSMKPGAANAGGMTADGRPLVGTLPVGNVAIGADLMEMERAVINDVFLVSLFQILVDSPQMTATEVLERTREKGALLSPTMGRQQSEYLGPLVEREIDVLAHQGRIPEMPPELIEAQGEYVIEYDSPLSRAQKAEEATGLFRYMEWAAGYTNSTGNPAPWDHINVDVAGPEIMDVNAVPARWRNTAEAVKQIRQGRAQAAQQQQAIEAAPALAGLAKAQ